MFVLKTLVFSALCACAYSQAQPHTTPVPILKQINKQNDDGSYSFGYEAADGSFKIETKYPNGDVAGKYGYIDENGNTREVSYGAGSQRGFEPQGSGIMVPPPTEHNPNINPLSDGQEDDGQYREDPSIYEDPKYNGRTVARPSNSFRFQQNAQQPRYQPQPQTQTYTPPQQTFQSQQSYQPQPTQYQQPQRSQFAQSNLFNQAPQQFTQATQQAPQLNQEYRPQSQVFHSQPQFSYQSYTPQRYQSQPTYQSQPAYQPQSNYQPQQNYQSQNYNPFAGHPAQNFNPSTGSYTIDFTG